MADSTTANSGGPARSDTATAARAARGGQGCQTDHLKRFSQPTLDSVRLFLDQATGEGKRLQELPSCVVLFCFGQVGEHLQETVALVRR